MREEAYYAFSKNVHVDVNLNVNATVDLDVDVDRALGDPGREDEVQSADKKMKGAGIPLNRIVFSEKFALLSLEKNS